MFSKQKLCRIQSGVYLDRFSTCSQDSSLKKPVNTHLRQKRLSPATSKYSLHSSCPRTRRSRPHRDRLKDLHQYIKEFSFQSQSCYPKGPLPRLIAPAAEYDKPLPALPYPQENDYSLPPNPKLQELSSSAESSGCVSEKEWLEHDDLTALPIEKKGKHQLPFVSEEPPDGGTLAWLHVFAGHLVILNAQ